MTPSEESITLMTSYRLPHHGNRFFAVALNDALPAFLATAADPLLALVHNELSYTVRLRIVVYRNDSNHKKAYSLYLPDCTLQLSLSDDFPKIYAAAPSAIFTP